MLITKESLTTTVTGTPAPEGITVDGAASLQNTEQVSTPTSDENETLGGGLPSNIFYDEDDAEVSDDTVYAGMARRGESPDLIKVPAMKAAYTKFLKTFKKS